MRIKTVALVAVSKREISLFRTVCLDTLLLERLHKSIGGSKATKRNKTMKLSEKTYDMLIEIAEIKTKDLLSYIKNEPNPNVFMDIDGVLKAIDIIDNIVTNRE